MITLFVVGTLFYLFSYRYFWTVESSESDNGPGYELVSHRGVTNNSPENTIEAYLAAVSEGFKWIELDVVTTQDRAVVCSHNFDLERETDLYGYIHTSSINMIRNAYTGVNAKSSGSYRVPELINVLNTIPVDVGINIEIKTSWLFDLTTARAICKIKKHIERRPFIISSFNPVALAYIHIFFRAAPTGFLLESIKYLWIVNWLHPTYLHPRADMIIPSLVIMCKNRNLKILTWTVNNMCAIKWCLKIGVVGIISDRGSAYLR